jgi:hypothetical protein
MADRRFPRLRAAALALAVAAPPAAADDLLERQKFQQAVADQRAQDLVTRGLADAQTLARRFPADAIQRLKATLTALDLDGSIGADKRQALAKQLQTEIARLEGKPAPAQPDPRLDKLKAGQRQAVEAGLAEAKAVRDTVAEVEGLYKAGKANAARVKVAELAKKYPANPAVLVLEGQGAVTDRLTEAKALAREQADRFTFAMNDVSRSALPAKKDLELAPDWKERQELRKRLEPRLGPDEEKILAALEKPVGPGVTNLPFEETLQNLSTLVNQPLYIDEPSLEAVGADKRRPVSVPGGVSARTALRAVLQSQGLTFVIRDKAIVVMSLEKAREALVTRAYYLGDAVAGVGPTGGAVNWGPLADAQQTMANAQLIVDAITRSVDPMVWKEKGGPASITFHYPSLSLIVRAPAEVQAGLATKLGR